MEYLNFSSLTEKDFDEIVLNAGGRRYTNDPRIKEKNCDYILDDAVIELKIIEEEPIEKKAKQEKFVKLFPANAETVMLYPSSEEQKYQYFKILQSPIQSALKKASKQLQKSAKEIGAQLKIAIIMNNGLYMVSKNEFKEMAIARVKNDTSGIDILIICSMYYYSDKFDMRVLFDFDDTKINQIDGHNAEEIINKLKKSWNANTERYMTEQLRSKNLNRTKEPIKDLYFDCNGIRYVKPPIQWGKNSDFWKNGRPREDTTKENDLPLISIVPMFNEEAYIYLQKNMLDSTILQSSLKHYIEWIEENPIKTENKIQLMVYIKLDLSDLKNLPKQFNESNLQSLANIKHKALYRKIKDEMTEYQENIVCNNFILVDIQEIGMDKANDIAFISHITNNSNQEYLIDGIRISYEYAIALAIAFCIVTKTKKVYFIRNEDFKWK